MKVGLRVDVDTYRGTRDGVPHLLKLFQEHSISATFFFSVGPDNMGRHLWRLVRPSFFKKMLRSKAPRLYGWEILLRGTFWPGPVIGEELSAVIRAASNAEHEVGLHAWDHYAWQTHLDSMTPEGIHLFIKKGLHLLMKILGYPPSCSAAPAWKCNDVTLSEKAKFPFKYNSDCRGGNIFYPSVNGRILSQPQIPVTLPTYDEVIGRDGISDRTYNDYIISLFRPGELNVLAIHAEVEGMACDEIFRKFLKKARKAGASFVPLGTLLIETPSVGQAEIGAKHIKGRAGWVSCQRQEGSKR